MMTASSKYLYASRAFSRSLDGRFDSCVAAAASLALRCELSAVKRCPRRGRIPSASSGSRQPMSESAAGGELSWRPQGQRRRFRRPSTLPLAPASGVTTRLRDSVRGRLDATCSAARSGGHSEKMLALLITVKLCGSGLADTSAQPSVYADSQRAGRAVDRSQLAASQVARG